MRIAVVSDIHANLPALRAIQGQITDTDMIVCLGDLIGYYCQVNEVLDWIRTRGVFCVRGNHDDMLFTGKCEGLSAAVRFGIDYADRVIDSDHRKWLSALPLSWGGFLGQPDSASRLSALLFHGSPWSPLSDYLYANSEKIAQLFDFAYDLLAFGQTHHPLLIQRERRLILNPGSVGQSRHRPAVACAAVLDFTSRHGLECRLLESEYDPSPVISFALENGAGQWIAKHLR